MRDDPTVVALVTRAAASDQGAWDEIVDRYAPLVWSICTGFRLSNHDIEDVAQNVWLLLVGQLGTLREPAALPGWLATTTRRECLRVVTAARRSERLGTELDEAAQFVADTVVDEEILAAERNAALRAAFAELPPRCQQLLSMLLQRSALLVRDDQRHAGHPGRKHRPAASPLPGTDAQVQRPAWPG